MGCRAPAVDGGEARQDAAPTDSGEVVQGGHCPGKGCGIVLGVPQTAAQRLGARTGVQVGDGSEGAEPGDALDGGDGEVPRAEAIRGAQITGIRRHCGSGDGRQGPRSVQAAHSRGVLRWAQVW